MVCIPIVCSCPSVPKTVHTPSNYQDPPKNVLCPRCNTVNDTCYKVNKVRCEICFCCCIPCGKSNPYLACSRCNNCIGNIELYRCTRCHIGTTAKTRYCYNCGELK
ncbi:hypothetical protein GINT2_001519 [Glugoides intestinalis]